MTPLTEAEMIARYDAERDGSAYVKPTDNPFCPDPDIDAIIAILEAAEKRSDDLRTQIDAANVKRAALEAERDDVLIGHIDGFPVLAHYMIDVNDPGEDGLAWATVEWNGINVSTDGDSYLNLPITGDMGGDMKPAEWPLIKRLAQTDVCERLITLALRYPRFRDVPPTPPPAAPIAPVVRTCCWYRDPNENGDLTDEPCGPLAYIDYLCGEGDAEASISFDVNNGSVAQVRLAHEAIESLDALNLAMPNMFVILNDPRVQAARAKNAA